MDGSSRIILKRIEKESHIWAFDPRPNNLVITYGPNKYLVGVIMEGSLGYF